MDALWIVVVSFVGYLIAYHTYGRFLAEKIFKLRGDAPVPSRVKEDGVDYVPTRKGIIFGHHFTSIAGTGPILGPAIGILFGWVPALIWVFVGSIVMGAVHDLGALVISLRHEGRSIADIVAQYVNRRVRMICFLIVFLELWIVIAIFGLVIAILFGLYPVAVFPIWMEIPIAVVLGYMTFRGRIKVALCTLLAVMVMYFTVVQGHWLPLAMPAEVFGIPSTGVWTIILLAYAYVASTLPVTTLLQPRDYINAWQLFIMMALLVAAAVATSLSVGLPMVAPAFNRQGGEVLGPLFPFLFVTIACGAISGFHSLVSSGTSAKQVSGERDALFVGYGSMLMEGALAVLVIVTVGAGLGLGYEAADGEMLTGVAAWGTHYADFAAASKLPGKVTAVVVGAANMMSTLGVPQGLGLVIMGVFIASFAGTTLDTATRIQRYVITEISSQIRMPALGNRWVATGVAVVTAALLAFSTGWGGKGAAQTLWPMFGAVNQLLAALALLLVSLYLRRRGGLKFLVTLGPCLFMLVMTVTAMFMNERKFVGQLTALLSKEGAGFPFGQLLLVVINGAALVLALWMAAEGFVALWKGELEAKAGAL